MRFFAFAFFARFVPLLPFCTGRTVKYRAKSAAKRGSPQPYQYNKNKIEALHSDNLIDYIYNKVDFPFPLQKAIIHCSQRWHDRFFLFFHSYIKEA
jgi:hypothetical protein